jgi:protein phosphatase
MRVRFAGLTDVGRSRNNNEDNFYISQAEPLCVVADGMGGHNSGEIASLFAVRTIRDFYERTVAGPEVENLIQRKLPPWPFQRRPPDHPEERRLVQAVMLANEFIHRYATERPDCKGMGTTLVGAYFLETGMYLIHIGDSRGYVIRRGGIERVTKDHSLADEYLNMGILRQDELAYFPYKNVITRALGLNPVVEPEVRFVTIQPGDTYVFCTDGLTDPLSDAQILEIVSAHGEDVEAAARALVDAANEAGGPDNVTVVIAQTY